MRAFRSCCTIILLLLALPIWADQLIIEPDMGRKPIINAINDAHHSIQLVMYGFTDKQLLNAIMQQNKQHRTVNIILEPTPYKAESENHQTIAQLDDKHIAWQAGAPAFRLTHQKTLIIDGRKAIIMTFNFTNSSFNNQRNFALILDDSRQVNDIATVFSADWNHIPSDNHTSRLIFSPDDSRHKLIALIDGAKRTLNIYAQSISDFKIVGALAKAARRGVTVQILTSANIREKQANYLARAGVIIHRSKHLYIHAKVIIIDQREAVIGSINLTRASLDHNRELAVITDDTSVIKQLVSTFNSDWSKTDALMQSRSKGSRNFRWRAQYKFGNIHFKTHLI